MTKYLLFILVFTQSFSQNIETKTGLQNAAKAYGYILGQEYTLNDIKKNYSGLNAKTIEAELMFNISFGNAKNNIESLLNQKFSSEKVAEFRNDVIQDFLKLNINHIDQEEKAVTFIDEVKKRSKGDIESPVKEILFFYAFYNNPEEEFLNGFIQKFNTKNHVKSKGTNWSLKVPTSWIAKDADRPNIIQKFTSENGIGNESIMLLVKNLPENQKMTNQEIASLFTVAEAQEMVPENGKFLSFKKMTFDRIDGGMLEFEISIKRLDYEITTRMTQFFFIYNQKLFSIQCNVSSEAKNYNPDAYKKYSQLFKLVANSIVVDQQY